VCPGEGRCVRRPGAGHQNHPRPRGRAAGRRVRAQAAGEFRLRDLAEPELIYQLTHADLPAGFPPIRTIAECTRNLPLPVSSFIGRERELEQTAAALDRARVVTLTGPGGVGKTRLAVQVAGQIAGRFEDGAWLAELAPVRDPAGVDDAVAAVFSVTARVRQGSREALVEFLRSKQLLLVLDNCEHLIEAAAALAGDLARSGERLVVLATSREGLGIEGERLVPVPPLAVPGVGAELAAITEAEAVQLFAERGRGQARFHGDCGECGGGGRGGPAAGWDRAGGRAGGGPDAGDDGGRAGPAAGAQFRGAGGRAARRGGTAPDAAGHHRLVLPAARRARTEAADPAGRVRRRCHPRGGRGCL
jgi:NB-ARC domain